MLYVSYTQHCATALLPAHDVHYASTHGGSVVYFKVPSVQAHGCKGDSR